MDAAAIGALRPKLARFLKRFSHCGCEETCAHVGTYVEGQLTDLERKNVEQIALNAGVALSTATKNQPESQGGWWCLRFGDRNFGRAD